MLVVVEVTEEEVVADDVIEVEIEGAAKTTADWKEFVVVPVMVAVVVKREVMAKLFGNSNDSKRTQQQRASTKVVKVR